MAYHLDGTIFQTPKFWSETALGGFFGFGHAGVYFFFVLSGFIIASSHYQDIARPERVVNYLMRRIIRVYPVYWIVIIPIAVIYTLKPDLSKPELTAPSVIANSFLLIGVSTRASLAVAWTLFHEVLFYVMFAVLIVNRRVGTFVLGFWFVSCVAAAFVPASVVPPSFYPLGLVNTLFGLGLGCFALTQRHSLPKPVFLATLGCLGFLTAGIFELRFGVPGPAFSVIGYGLSSALIVCGLVSRERVRPIAVPRMLLLLGDASYSIYLVHYPTLSIVARLWLKVFGKTVWVDFAYLAIAAMATAAGVLFHLFVEKPVTRLLMKQWRNWQDLRKTPVSKPR